MAVARPIARPAATASAIWRSGTTSSWSSSRRPDGTRTPLPRQNVDTGMGLERLAMVMQGVESIYDIDLYQAIIQHVAKLAGVTYGGDPEIDRALRIIADHTRGGTFLIADGVLPGQRGPVLRPAPHPAPRDPGRPQAGSGRSPFLAEVAGVVIDQFAHHHPELCERRAQIEKVLTHEEESFGRTLQRGHGPLPGAGRGPGAGGGGAGRDRGQRPAGREVFRLYDTYGFPFDLTVELAREQGLEVDQAGFEEALAEQREIEPRWRRRMPSAIGPAPAPRSTSVWRRARPSSSAMSEIAADALILGLVGPDGPVEEAEAGQPVEVILDRTPFYGESGGQIGDTGSIRTDTGRHQRRRHLQADAGRLRPPRHRRRGLRPRRRDGAGRDRRRPAAGDPAQSHRDAPACTARCGWSLGEETHQAGSLVAPDRLRFDFTSLEAVDAEPAAVASRRSSTTRSRATPR